MVLASIAMAVFVVLGIAMTLSGFAFKAYAIRVCGLVALVLACSTGALMSSNISSQRNRVVVTMILLVTIGLCLKGMRRNKPWQHKLSQSELSSSWLAELIFK